MITESITKKGPWLAVMEPSLDERNLVDRLAGGEETALSELYDLYGRRLYAYAFRLTGDPDKAEDVLQEVLLTAWKSASRYRGEGRFIAWLLGIVHHTAMNSLRHLSIPLSEQLENGLQADSDSMESQTQQKLQGDWVRRGLDELSLEHREVLELVFYQGLSLEEIAGVCRCPIGTVKSRLAYARKHLKGILTRQNPEEWK